MTQILVPGINVKLLREQRDALVEMTADSSIAGVAEDLAALDGVINLLDAMLDIAEGFPAIAAKGPL